MHGPTQHPNMINDVHTRFTGCFHHVDGQSPTCCGPVVGRQIDTMYCMCNLQSVGTLCVATTDVLGFLLQPCNGGLNRVYLFCTWYPLINTRLSCTRFAGLRVANVAASEDVTLTNSQDAWPPWSSQTLGISSFRSDRLQQLALSLLYRYKRNCL